MKWACLAIIILTVLLFAGGPDYYSSRLYKEIWEAGHILLFTISVFVLARMSVFKKYNLQIEFYFSTFFCLITGAVTEILQPAAGRSFEIKDLLYDILGGYLGLSLAVMSDKTHKKWIRISMLPVISTILFFAFSPVCRAAVNAINIARQFPVLSDFETPFELDRWNTKLATIKLNNNPVRHGKHAVCIVFNAGIYPGVFLDSLRRDWRGYGTLQFSLFNTLNNSIRINLKIYDRLHASRGYEDGDRFDRTIILAPGWNDIRVPLKDIRDGPLDRNMDLSDIVGFSLFLSGPDKRITLYLDDLRLSP